MRRQSRKIGGGEEVGGVRIVDKNNGGKNKVVRIVDRSQKNKTSKSARRTPKERQKNNRRDWLRW